MWQSFRSMPLLLKFLTFHALACCVFFVGVVVPNDSFKVDGRAIPFDELWSSGLAFFVAFVGLALPLAGVLLLRRASLARHFYIGVLVIGAVMPCLFMRDYVFAAMSVAVIGLLAWYVFDSPSAQAYFASNTSFESRRSASAAQLRR